MARKNRVASAAGEVASRRTLVVDPGAYTIKAGFSPSDPTTAPDASKQCRVTPNCIARSREHKTYVGSELERCVDFGEMVFKRPMERGYIVNWDCERAIWEHEFLDKNASLQVYNCARPYSLLVAMS